MPEITVREVKTALSETSLGAFHYALNPYRGCLHGCLYCYAPYVLREKREWGSFVEVRKNLPDVLLREIRRRGRERIIGLGTVTDPYQPVEKKYGVTRRCVEILKNSGRKFVIQTKSEGVLRDLDLLGDAKAEVGLTVTSIDERFTGIVEPFASTPAQRLNAVKVLGDAGISTYIFVGPIFPAFFREREKIDEFLGMLLQHNPCYVIFDRFRTRQGMMEKLLAKAPQYSEIFLEISKMTESDWQNLVQNLRDAAASAGLKVAISETESWKFSGEP